MGLFLLCIGSMSAQRTVVGQISDTDGAPLIGATILVKGTDSGTVTDIDGKYSVNVPNGANVLEISYTGYDTQEIALGASNVVSVSLESGVLLEDVIVVGYGERTGRNNIQSVSEIDGDAIKNIPAISPQQILQGQVSGVQMTNSSGVLGGASSIRVRGVASINAGGQPLFVVDGVPLNDGSDNNYSAGYGGAALNPLLNIAPDEIESMTVLKDASAAAIYGSRGANGVIIITTKKGQAGTNKINFTSSTGWLEATNLFEMTDTEGYNEIQEVFRGADPANLATNFFDWQDAVVQTGRTNDLGINFSGGTDKTQYFLGGSYANTSNYTIGNDLERFNGRLNFKHTISDRVRFGANISTSVTQSDRTSIENSTFAPLTSSYLQVPSVEAFNPDGTFANTGFIANVIAIEELGLVNNTTRRTTGNAFVKVDIIPNLTFTSDWGTDMLQAEEEFREVEAFTPGGEGSRDIFQDIKWLTTNSLEYPFDLGDSKLNVLVGQSYETSNFDATSVAGTGFAADALRNTGSAATLSTATATRSAWALNSFFGRANYILQDKYLFEASVRRDGSSRFGPNNRWGNFWAASAGWILSDEAFMANSSFFDFLKLRASYGVSGNDRIGLNDFLGLYEAGVLSDYGGAPGIRPVQAANNDLKWEETGQFDIGFESRFLNNRIGLDASFYVKTTNDLLLDFQLPQTSGFTNIARNAGSMTNTGIDLDINAGIVRTKDFNWNTTFNFAWLKNEVQELPEAALDADGNQFIEGSASQRAIVGQSVNTFYLIRYNGINSATGDAEWLDVNGDITNSPTAADRVIAGNGIPKFTGGLTNTFTYKGFDLNVFFNYVFGNSVYIGDLRFTENPNSGFNKSVDLLDYWREAGDESFAPNPASSTAGFFAQRSTLQLFDGSHIRLKNLSLGYTFRGKNFGVKTLDNFRVYVQGNNVWTWIADDNWRGQDIEVSANGGNNQVQGESFFATPQARSVRVGLNVTF